MNRKKKGWEGGCPAGTDWGAFKTNTSRDTKTVFSPKGTTSPLSPPGGGEKDQVVSGLVAPGCAFLEVTHLNFIHPVKVEYLAFILRETRYKLRFCLKILFRL